MAITDWGHPSGVIGRSTVALDSPGQIRYGSYVNSSGVETNEAFRMVRLFNDTGGATIKNAVYMVGFDGDLTQNPKIETCAAVTVDRQLVVATEAYADQTWGWYVFAGVYDVMVEGTTDVAVGDYLKLVAATDADALIKDGTSRTADSVAIACAAQAANSAVATKCFLFGDRCDID